MRSSKNAQCSACSSHRLELLRLCRLNEARARLGKPPLVDEVRVVKGFMASCAALGHHDPAGRSSRVCCCPRVDVKQDHPPQTRRVAGRESAAIAPQEETRGQR